MERNDLTIMHAFALIGSRNLTVMMPSGSCCRNTNDERPIEVVRTNSLTSYETTFVTSPRVAHSTLASSLRSKSNEGSSSNSSRVNTCFGTTTRPLLFAWSLNLPVAVRVGPSSSSESQSSNFLNFLMRSIQQETIQGTHLCTFASCQSSSSPSSYSQPSSPLLHLPAHPFPAAACVQTRLSEPSSS